MTDWLRQEQQEAIRDGAIPTKNSGRGMKKGDAQLDPFTVDYKFTGKGFTVNRAVWAKACEDAKSNNYSHPTIKVVIGEEKEVKTRLWVIDDSMFKEMLEAYRRQNEVRD